MNWLQQREREIAMVNSYRISPLGTLQAGCIREVFVTMQVNSYKPLRDQTQQGGCIREVAMAILNK